MSRPKALVALTVLEGLEREYGSLEAAGGYQDLSARTLQRRMRELGRPRSDTVERQVVNLLPGGHNRCVSDAELAALLIDHGGNNSAVARALGVARETVSRRRSALANGHQLDLHAQLAAHR